MSLDHPLARGVQSLAARARARADLLRDNASRVLATRDLRWHGRAATAWVEQLVRVGAQLRRAAEAQDDAADRLEVHAVAVQEAHDVAVALALAAEREAVDADEAARPARRLPGGGS